MPVYEHVTHLPHARADVFAWHERPGAFVRLTPPGMATIVQPPSDGLRAGSTVRLRVSHPVVAGGSSLVAGRSVGVPWALTHVEYAPGEGFVDEQTSGPFRRWRHEHEFADAPDGGTTITDRVRWETPVPVPRGLVEGRLAGLFRFRAAQLRGDLALHARLGERLRVAVAGSSGLVGTQLCALLASGGHEVTRLVRREAGPGEASWDPGAADTGRTIARDGRLDPRVLEPMDAVVNLAGRSIGGRFTRRAKQEIHHSRVLASSTLARALAGLADGRPRALVQASAVGLYGARRPGETLREDAVPGRGFLADVVRHWEAAAAPAEAAGVRVAHLRTGIALCASGGALLPMLPLFAVGLGGPLTNPDATVSWITLDDLARAYLYAVAEPLSGPYNAVAPDPATWGEFAAGLGRVMNRPAAVPTPGFGPRLLLGRGAYDQLVRTDQRVSCERLQDAGFAFEQPALRGALAHVLAH